jgi:hypothetical protein
MSYPWSQTMPYWWHTVAPSGGRGELTGTSVQPDESWASSVTPLGETGGLLDNLSRPPYQSWPEPKSMTALNAGPTAGVDWLGLARKTFEPITSYPATYSQMNQEAREQIGHGVEQLKHVYTPGVHDPVTFLKALGNIGFGTLGYVASPISAGLRTIAGKPVEDLTGIPKEYSEFALSLGIPGLGLRPAFRAPTSVPRSVVGRPANDLSPVAIVRKSEHNIHEPPVKPQRPFEADYPYGARTDPSGTLTQTIEGRPVTARYVAGRRELGGPDVGLTPTQFENVITELSGQPPQKVARGSRELPQGIGVTRWIDDGQTPPHLRDYRVYIDRHLNPGDMGRVTGHEMSHVVHEKAGAPIPPPAALRELRENYSTLSTGQEGARPLRAPDYFGYPSSEALPELVVEGMRGYATNPNYFKTVAPEAAAWIRAWANANPWIRDVIQFNALTGLLAGGIGSRNWPSPSASPPTMPNE